VRKDQEDETKNIGREVRNSERGKSPRSNVMTGLTVDFERNTLFNESHRECVLEPLEETGRTAAKGETNSRNARSCHDVFI
jgi:hypothetical protein